MKILNITKKKTVDYLMQEITEYKRQLVIIYAF